MEFCKYLFTNSRSSAIIATVLARWCSRLARQPVTLEVDGSSPFRVAKKEVIPFGVAFFMCKERTRKPALGNMPVACCNRRGFSAEKRVRSGSPKKKSSHAGWLLFLCVRARSPKSPSLLGWTFFILPIGKLRDKPFRSHHL